MIEDEERLARVDRTVAEMEATNRLPIKTEALLH